MLEPGERVERALWHCPRWADVMRVTAAKCGQDSVALVRTLGLGTLRPCGCSARSGPRLRCCVVVVELGMATKRAA